MKKLIFEPVDTLFFRDGRPFNQGEGTAGIESLFPPSPLSMVGAARASWATRLGWPGKGRWTDAICTQLGGDGKELDNLRFIGPLLEHDGSSYFPAPASLVGINKNDCTVSDLNILRPGDPVQCDLGEAVRLPYPKTKMAIVQKQKRLGGWWISQKGMHQLLQNSPPANSTLIHQSQLWSMEPRVGNQINNTTGTVEEGMLYSIQHVRLQEDVKLVMGIEGTLDGFPEKALTPLGGEARICHMTLESGDICLPKKPSFRPKRGKIRYAVYVITPLRTTTPPQPNLMFSKLPGTVVSACLPTAQRWGGWDSIAFKPLPMTPHLPPGSVLFMETESKNKNTVADLHGQQIGELTTWGYGLIAIGQW